MFSSDVPEVVPAGVSLDNSVTSIDSLTTLSPEYKDLFDKSYPLQTGDLVINEMQEQLNSAHRWNLLPLPVGVEAKDLSAYLAKLFPEMSGAENVTSRLSSEEWRFLGIHSGNPLEARLGDSLNIEKLYRLTMGLSQAGGNVELERAIINNVFKEDNLTKLTGI
jgi:hypothetical protein